MTSAKQGIAPPDTALLEYTLPSGQLTLRVDSADLPPHDLFEVGLRRNPKRGFLLVSRVLGKHLPVSPRVVLGTHERLAAKLGALPEGTLFVGMSETATALGRGVFEAYARQQDLPAGAALFITTTRYRFADVEALTFEEVHSHATTQWLHVPYDDRRREAFLRAPHVVVIDDEQSTGATTRALLAALAGRLPHLAGATVVSLTDFTPADAWEAAAVPVRAVSLLRGELNFRADPAWQPQLPPVTGGGRHTAPRRAERTGVWAGEFLPTLAELATFGMTASPGERVRVLGTGEFMYAPLHAAALLEREGADVRFHASTRSPVVEYGPIHGTLTFTDNYGEGIENYLYNFDPAGQDHVFALYETSALARGHDLPRLTGARKVLL